MTSLGTTKWAARARLQTCAGFGRFLAVLVLCLSTPAFAEDVSAYAERLAELRAEVADLQESIELEKEDQRGALRSLDAQKAELEAQVRREELRIRQLRDAVAEREALIADDLDSASELVPVVKQTLAALRTSVKAGLPYRLNERLTALDELERKLDEGSMRPQRAAAQTWQFVEDELRLTRESAMDRQVVPFEGNDHLAEVARIGMIAMYFRTGEGQVGRAVLRDGQWAYEAFASAADIERVDNVFDALTKQIRQGWFELPVEGM